MHSHPFVLSDVCTLHTAPPVVTQPAQHARGRSAESGNSRQDLSVETDNLAPPFSDLNRVDSAQDDADSAIPRLEIAPGDPLLRPRGIHSPTVSRSAVSHFPDLSPTAQPTPLTNSHASTQSTRQPSTVAPPTSISSSINAQRRSNLLGVSNPVFSFPSPGSSIAASSHPALPISRVGSPDYYTNGNGGSREDTGGNTTPTGLATPSTSYLSHPGSAANGSASSPASSFHSPSSQSQSTSSSSSRRSKWILHPRRGHAALNSGIKSLSGRSGRELVVVGRPDDLEKVTNLIPSPAVHPSQSPTKNYPIPESASPGAVSPGALAGNGIGWGKLGQGELSARERRDLERGLKEMGGPTTGDGASGISCVPVWLEDDVHTSAYSYTDSSQHLLIARSYDRFLRRILQDVPLADLPLSRALRLPRQGFRGQGVGGVLRCEFGVRKEGVRSLAERRFGQSCVLPVLLRARSHVRVDAAPWERFHHRVNR